MGARLNRKHLSLNTVAPEFMEQQRPSNFLRWGERNFSLSFTSEVPFGP